MIIEKDIQNIRRIIKEAKSQGKTVGFVPTMGYLHRGHISLVEQAKRENGFVVMSIFVNPTQFGEGEDFEAYPRDMERDSQMAKEAGVDVLFNPNAEQIYPKGYKTFVDVEQITHSLCGASRPGHFRGVSTVVAKLFNIVKPDKAYFGQKDAQQVSVITQMVRDLNMDIGIVPCPIVREEDGLAMSSRNAYLNTEQRKAALILSKALFMAKEIINNGEQNAYRIKQAIAEKIQTEPLANIDYIKIVDAIELINIDQIKGDILIALAVRIGKTRLIDNIRMVV
jgi:pantoate--beta-alanine ligase